MSKNSKLNLTATSSTHTNVCSNPNINSFPVLDQPFHFQKETSFFEQGLKTKKIKKAKRGAKHSLFQISQSFIRLANQYSGRELNINFVVDSLGLKKRRLYDVLNVMKGVGKIKKFRRNIIQLQDKQVIKDLQQEKMRLQMEMNIIDKKQVLMEKMKLDLTYNEFKNVKIQFQSCELSEGETQNKDGQNTLKIQLDQPSCDSEFTQLGNQNEHLNFKFDLGKDSLGLFLQQTMPKYRLQGQI